MFTVFSLSYLRLTEIKLDLCCLMRCGLAVVVVVVGRCLLFVVCCLVFVVCCLLFVVCCCLLLLVS